MLLERGGLGGVLRKVLRIPGLEHKGHGAGELHGLQRLIRRFVERAGVWPVREHAVVETYTSWNEAVRLRVVSPINQPHKLGHNVHVIPRWTE